MIVKYYDWYDNETHMLEIQNCDYSVEQLKDIFGANNIEYYHWGIRFTNDEPGSDTIWCVDIDRCGNVELFHKGKGKGCVEMTDEEYKSVDEYLKEYSRR